MQRYCLALDLKEDPELIAQYEAHHRAVWPEILASIREAGILDMQIYRTGNRLFMIMEVSAAFDGAAKAAADATNPKVVEWEQLMDTFQQRLPWAAPNQKWVPMEKIFALNS
ncbi:MAG: L-rhamnose mutarotase [Flavipsychrobacter sp.]|nr:L-rhamnose mutarotase [Flavipsychrobacter sp.]